MDRDQGQAPDAVERVAFLKHQADWCVDMATKTANMHLFKRYIELAASYQQQAADIEEQLRLVPFPRTAQARN